MLSAVWTLAAITNAGLLSCGLFGGSGPYASPVTGAAVDPESRRYIAAMADAGSRGGFWIASDPVEVVNLANNGTPTFRVRQKVPYHQFDALFPWSPSFRIEPLSDAHAIVVQTQSCKLYETYNTSFTANVLSAYSGAWWNLRAPFVPLAPGNPSAMASGLSLYAGMVRWDEIASGSINHALNWAAPAGTVSQWNFVRPASDAEGIAYKGSSAYRLPYGARLRLRADFDIARFGPQSAAIARAMKRYGIYLADTARENELYNSLALDGSNPWDGHDLSALSAIHITDFEVLALPRADRVPGH